MVELAAPLTQPDAGDSGYRTYDRRDGGVIA
jgi:hypothetical protein